jgi:Ca2+-dependent lipid-binding protein
LENPVCATPCFNVSDPYLKISKSNGDSQNESLILKTEYVRKTLDPVWKEFQLSLGRLCNNNPSLPLHIECWDWDSDGGDDFIGEFKVVAFMKLTFRQLWPKCEQKKHMT